MKNIISLITLLSVSVLPAFAQTTVTLPMTDISTASICLGESVSITASAASMGNAIDLNGTSSSVLIPNSASVSLSGSSNFTVSCWIYPRSNGLQSILYHGRGCSTWGSWGLGIGGTESAEASWAKKIAFYFRTSNGAASTSVVASSEVVLNKWVHVAVTYDGSNLRLYLNGVLDKTTAATGTPWNSTEALSMGSDPGCSGRNFYNGKLDEVQFWNKTRSASEISGSYDKVSVPATANLAAYWRFDENNGDYVYDVSANKNIGTINTSVSREIPSTAPMPVMSSTATTFAWSPGTGLSTTTGATVTAAPTTKTDYTVTATNTATGDINTNIVRINVNPQAAKPTVTTPLTYCQAATVSPLAATKGSTTDTLLWYTVPAGGIGSKTAPVPSTTMPGSTMYYVSAKSSLNCEGKRDSIRVNVQPSPDVSVSSISASGAFRCRNVDSVILKATSRAAVSYQWYYKDKVLAGSTTDTAHARKTGYWYAEVKGSNGCSNKDSVLVQEDTLEDPVLTPEEKKICTGGSALMTCNPGYVASSYSWYRNGVLVRGTLPIAHTMNISDTGNYYVVMTNAAGCTYTSNNAKVSFFPLTPKPSLVYAPPVLAITGGTYIAFQWYRGSKWIFGGTGSTHMVTDKGPYYVEVTDANGCTNHSDTLDIQPPTGINPQYAGMTLKLYPNPAHTSVTVDAPVKVNVTVTDMIGKTLLSIKNTTTVDLANFADGSYFFRISDEHGRLLAIERVNKISVR